MPQRLFRQILSAPAAFLVALTLSLLPATPAFAEAGMLDTGSLIQQASTEQTRAELLQRLDEAAVQEQLVAMGVDPEHARERVARLTDDELAALEARMDSEPAGAASVLGVVAVVFLVLIITDAMGVTDIFPFVRAQR